MKKNKIIYIPARGKLLGNGEVETTDLNGKKAKLTAKNIIWVLFGFKILIKLLFGYCLALNFWPGYCLGIVWFYFFGENIVW